MPPIPKPVRPPGVTAIACMQFVTAGCWILLAVASLATGLLILGWIGGVFGGAIAVASVMFAVISIVCGIAMLRLRRWARLVTLFACALFSCWEIVALAQVREPNAAILVLLFSLASNVAVIWYLTRPHVKELFA